ncbi:MAG: prolyl oligopeptidase family serine peptidase [Fuerstiella sp.]
MRSLVLALVVSVVGCDTSTKSGTRSASPSSGEAQFSSHDPSPGAMQTLVQARSGFVTKIVKEGESYGPADIPPGNDFQLIRYQSPVGDLSAYVTSDPGDGQKHPAIVWITGGDNNSIGDVWSENDRSNDQSASAFRKAGIVMMFPSQRGGNDNPGKREGFYGEVDDILAATEHLANLPYVDPQRIYLGGHSTGGTMVMMVAECSDRYQAVFSLGPVAAAEQYGGDCVFCNPFNEKEMNLRSPRSWLHCVQSPMYVFEGARQGNWSAIEQMANQNTNSKVQFFKVPGYDHFSVIAPLAEVLADQIVKGQVHVSQQTVIGLR